ncbi:hypothetical protein RB625_19755 [Streptomyces californicus]|uniref:hypothetical protein n=1 Tax=Streptomyces californicus TaxID=67351 RepID=UPI00296E9AA0|nr:hypothetical protein [Streptomyces californicus]MDW4900648.1 hypothetical protein [Streptomyces californicus]
MRTRYALTAASALLAGLSLTGCGSTPEPEAAARPKASPSSTPTREFDAHDCRAVLERNYEADTVYDASTDPECAELTQDEYAETVASVIKGHKDDIVEDAANETAWDIAWEATDKKQQGVVCDRLAADGALLVGQEMMNDATEPSGKEIEMAQYYLDEKC